MTIWQSTIRKVIGGELQASHDYFLDHHVKKLKAKCEASGNRPVVFLSLSRKEMVSMDYVVSKCIIQIAPGKLETSYGEWFNENTPKLDLPNDQ